MNQRGSFLIPAITIISVLVIILTGAFYLKKQSENVTAKPNSANVSSTEPSVSMTVNQGRPLSSATEQFFNQVVEDKAKIYKAQFEEAEKTGNWQTYKNEQFGYQFSYPATWALPQGMMGDPDFHIFYANSNPEDYYYLDFKNANQLDKNSLNNYCDSNNRDSRCETLSLNNTKAVIDWGNSEYEKAVVTILHPTKKLQAVFELKPITEVSKKSFKEIISTFKFN